MMGPLLTPAQIARFDQIDASIRDLMLCLGASDPGLRELPQDPFLGGTGSLRGRPRHRSGPSPDVRRGAAGPDESFEPPAE